MPLSIIIKDGTNKKACVIPKKRDLKNGLLCYKEPARIRKNKVIPFNNVTFGNKLNLNATATGASEIVHNGGTSTEWNATANSGPWNFTTGGIITLANTTVNNSTADFNKPSSGSIELSNYVSFSGKVRLNLYEPGDSIKLRIRNNNGVLGPARLSLDGFIDETIIGTFQNFVIPLVDFGVISGIADEFRIIVQERGSGIRVGVSFDDLQFDSITGVPVGVQIFTAGPNLGEVFYLDKIIITLVDAFTGIVTNGTMQGLVYNQILGESQLTNGINIQRKANGEIKENFIIKDMSDFLFEGFGFKIIDVSISDGTNTNVTLEYNFSETQVLKFQDEYRIIISDDLSGLITFKASLHGKIEKL